MACKRRTWVATAALLLGSGFSLGCWAQAYPAKPIRLGVVLGSMEVVRAAPDGYTP